MRNTILLVLMIFAQTGLSQPELTDSSGLTSFMDGMIQAHLDSRNIAGATVAVVQDTNVIFSKGYGYADIDRDRKVDPDRTLFRIGSISKLFVWTAIMQLYEQGKVELDVDVNRYLDEIQVPDTYTEPVTLKALMTHTAGFEDYILGLFARDTGALRPLDEILQQQMPARVRPPGRFASYSNHGTGIAACVVEAVSGQSWNDYVEEHILNTLNMNHTTFRQPVPPSLPGSLSKGYKFRNGELQQQYFEYIPLAPVGAASSTATDMAKFMITHLQKGSFRNNTILDSSVAKMMQSPAFRPADNINSMAYGFMELSQNKTPIIGHGGDTFWFHSLMILLPRKNAGLFISFNSENGNHVKNLVLEEFMDHFFPEKLGGTDFYMPPEELSRFEGEYRSLRHPHERFTKIAAVMNPVYIKTTTEGMLKVTGRDVTHYIPIGKLTFRAENSSEKLAFKQDRQGKITHMLRGQAPYVAFEKVRFINNHQFHLTLFYFSVLMFLITFLHWPVAYLIRKEYNERKVKHLPLHAKCFGWMAAFFFLMFFFGATTLMFNSNEIAFGLDTEIKYLFTLSVTGTIITPIVLFITGRLLWLNKHALLGNIHYVLLCLALLITNWQLYHWNMLGYQF
ncbi:MAG: beta-lactamase family protein [Bacteroidales bacterium]|nr:beta-lactamase family protein [Bacteroidales bacterium]